VQYIPATMTNQALTRLHPAGGRPTKVALRAAIKAGQDLEFVSASAFHRPGSYFTLREAVATFGPVGIEVRYLGTLVAMVEAVADGWTDGQVTAVKAVVR